LHRNCCAEFGALYCSNLHKAGKLVIFAGRPYRRRHGGDLPSLFRSSPSVSQPRLAEVLIALNISSPSCADSGGRPQLSSLPAAVGLAVPDLAAGHRRDILVKPTVVQHRKGFRLHWRVPTVLKLWASP
jgi:hypothetical protein